MASFMAASAVRRFGNVGGFAKGGLILAATAGVATATSSSSSWFDTTASLADCEAAAPVTTTTAQSTSYSTTAKSIVRKRVSFFS